VFAFVLLEAYQKKRYPAHFVSKITDSDMENAETSGWLDFSFACMYIDESTYKNFLGRNAEIGRLFKSL
jgi:four helix bundle protein